MGGAVYAVGGFNSSLRERTVDVYDGGRDQWSAVTSMQERRSTLGAAVLGDLLYAVGGFNGSIGNVARSSFGLEPRSLLTSPLPSCPLSGRFVHSRSLQLQKQRVDVRGLHEHAPQQRGRGGGGR